MCSMKCAAPLSSAGSWRPPMPAQSPRLTLAMWGISAVAPAKPLGCRKRRYMLLNGLGKTSRDDTSRPLKIEDDADGFPRIVGQRHQFHIARTNKFAAPQRCVHPFQQTAPILAPDQDDGKARDALGLHQRDDF